MSVLVALQGLVPWMKTFDVLIPKDFKSVCAFSKTNGHFMWTHTDLFLLQFRCENIFLHLLYFGQTLNATSV